MSQEERVAGCSFNIVPQDGATGSKIPPSYSRQLQCVFDGHVAYDVEPSQMVRG